MGDTEDQRSPPASAGGSKAGEHRLPPTHSRLKELLQHLQLLLRPGTCVFWGDLELQRLVVLRVEGDSALEHVRLEHDDPRFVGVHDGQLEGEKKKGQEGAGPDSGGFRACSAAPTLASCWMILWRCFLMMTEPKKRSSGEQR